MTSILSNAHNFHEYINSGVDTRTGMFSMSINIGNFVSHKGTGITIPLVFNYNPSDDIDLGMGRGWSLPLSRFDISNNALQLSSGQSFQIFWNDLKGEYDIPYRKLKDIRVLYLSDTEEIKIVYKDGKKEFISYYDGCLTKIVTVQGLEISFEYGFYRGRQVLSSINDNDGRKLVIDWWSDNYDTSVTNYINESPLQLFVFHKFESDRVLKSFSSPLTETLLNIEYMYFPDSNIKVINKIIHSSGLVEDIIYHNGHFLPDGSPIKSIPYVHSHTVYPGDNQEAKYITYGYSDRNYLGFGSDRRWNANEDTLFSAASDYRYTTEEIINGTKKIVREYNKYHLLESTDHYDNDFLFKKEEFDYYAVLNSGIEYQPAQYSLMKEQRVTNYDNQRNSNIIVLKYEYDEYANLTKETLADGSVIARSYYSSAGEGMLCPQDRNGMVYLLKDETYIPNFQVNSELLKKRTITYQSLPDLYDQDSNFIVLLKETTGNESVEYRYFNDRNNPYTYGRIKQEEHLINNYVTSILFSYEIISDNFRTQQTTTTFDGLSFIESETIDSLFMLPIETIDKDRIKTVTEYDEIGRRQSVTLTPNTDYSASTWYQYDIGNNQNVITQTDSNGNVIKIELNNAGNLIRIKQKQSRLSNFKITQEHWYDNFGLVNKTVDIDWANDREIRITQLFQYDSSGQVKQITHSDGREERIEQNLATLSVINEQVGLLTEITTYNLSEQMSTKTTRDKNGNVLAYTSYLYDVYSNLTEITDTEGRVIRYQYDEFNRVISITRQIDNSDITETYQYPEFTTAAIPTQVAINNIIIGTRSYDGLLRLLSESSAGGTTTYTYEGASLEPSQQITPNGDQINYIFDEVLKQPISLSVLGEPSLTNIYDYNKITGLPTSNLSMASENNVVYDSYGRIVNKSIFSNDHAERTSSFKYSLKDKLLEETDYIGNTKHFEYDDFGRPSTIRENLSNNLIVTNIYYDTFSRPNKYVTSDGIHKVKLEVGFNSFGFETSRIMSINDLELISTGQSYNDSLLLERRIYTDASGVTTETFFYDELNRLIEYSCDGSNKPKDELGKEINRQTFNYDVYGNIITSVSFFSNGQSENIMTCTYDSTDPNRLINITNTHPDYPEVIHLNYDLAGNLLNDEKGQQYIYDALGRVESVFDHQDVLLSKYKYNAHGELVSQTIDGYIIYLSYLHGNLVNETCGGVSSSYVRHAPGLVVRHVTQSEEHQCQVLMGNAQGSVLKSTTLADQDQLVTTSYNYTAYGQAHYE